MDDVQELRERTNPVFNTAKATVMQLAQAGNADAGLLAERLGIDIASVAGSDEQRKAMSLSNVAILELRYGSMNAFIQATGAKTVVDLPCGYTPRALEDFMADKRYIACDLPAVADEMGPLAAKVLAERGQRRDVKYYGVDATNYKSVRAALNGAEGPLCITTEGLLMYLTESELAAVCDCVRRLLEEFGGVWITPDPEVTRVYIAVTMAVMGDPSIAAALTDALGGKADMGTVLRAMAGDKARSTLNATRDTFSDKAEVNFGNVLTVKGTPEQFAAAEGFLRRHGLKTRRTPVAEKMPKLNSLDPDRQELVRQAMEHISLWTMTPEGKLPARQADTGDAFSVAISAQGGAMGVVLRGRVDSISAPDFLAAYEKAARTMDVRDIHIDMSALAYISSAGLRVLLMMIKRVGQGHVSVSGTNKTVRDILTQTGYADMLMVDD